MAEIQEAGETRRRGAGLTTLIIIFAVVQTLFLVFLVVTLLGSDRNQPGEVFCSQAWHSASRHSLALPPSGSGDGGVPTS